MRKNLFILIALTFGVCYAFALQFNIFTGQNILVGSQLSASGPDRDTIYRITLTSEYVSRCDCDTSANHSSVGDYTYSNVHLTVVDPNNGTIVNKTYSFSGTVSDDITIAVPSGSPLITFTNNSNSTGYVSVVLTADEF